MSELYGGMLWLVRPDEAMARRLETAVAYAEEKHGKPVLRVLHPMGESYPAQWGTIPVRPDKRMMANHLFLVNEIEVVEVGDGAD